MSGTPNEARRWNSLQFHRNKNKTKTKQNKTDRQTKKTCNLEVLLRWKTNCK